MYFSTELHQIFILFQQWRVTTIKGVSGSIVAVLALAVLYECVKGLNVYLRSPIKNQSGRATVMKNRIYSEDIRSEAFTRILKTCLFMAELSFAYFLMLITMTCNIWLFIAVVIGRGSGFYLVSPLISSYVGSEETDDCIGISINLLSTRHQQLWHLLKYNKLQRRIQVIYSCNWMVMYDLKLGRNPFICRFYQSFQYFFRHNKTCNLLLQAVVAVWHAFDKVRPITKKNRHLLRRFLPQIIP